VTVPSIRWRGPRTAVTIGLLALAVRVFYLSESASSPLFDVPVVDALTYVEDARYLKDVSWLGRPAPFWQPPLYPYLLALIFTVGGEDLYPPRLVQALLGACTCVLVYLIGLRLFPRGVAIGAGLAAALYGPLIYFDGELLPTTLAIFLYLLLLGFLVAAPLSRRWPWMVAGLLLGFSALAVANILLFLPALIGWQWWVGNSDRRWTAQQSALLLLGCSLTIAPVTLRNYRVGDDVVLISHNAGINFYIGNNPDYDRTVFIRPGKDWAHLVEMPEREAGIDRPSRKSRFFFGRSWDYISADPLGYLSLLARKLYLFWRGDEVLRNLDPYFARNDSALLSALLWKRGLAFPFGLVAPLALVGLAVFWRTRKGCSPRGRLFLLFVLASMASVVLFFVTSRYRLPVTPLLLLFAACALRALLVSQHRRKIILALPPLLLLSNAGTGAMDMEGDELQHYWLGYAYEQKGMPSNAVREYNAARERRPDFQDVLLNLAALYGEQRQPDKAATLYRQFLELYPHEAPVRYLLGNACLLARRYPEAIAAFEEIAIRRPGWAAIHGRLGYAYLMANQPGRAAEAYRRTLELKPDSSLVRYQLAQLYGAEQHIDRAVQEYGLLLTQHPDEPDYPVRLADLLIEAEARGRPTMRLERTPRLRSAEELLRRALDLAAGDAHPYWSLGMLLARQERYEEAIPLFERLLEIATLDYQAHLFLGHLYKRTGRFEEADSHFDQYSLEARHRRMRKTAEKEVEKQLQEVFGSGSGLPARH